ncbi:MAG: mycofactocin precursor MftA [Solirubrobacteraceae bacterium]
MSEQASAGAVVTPDLPAGAVVTPDPPASAAVTVGPPVAVLERDPAAPVDALVESDLLVEDISIDGMCGVY